MIKRIVKKLIKFIKIKVLIKELEFRAPRTQKNTKTTNYNASGMSL
jgi:hypothetical protein